MKLFEIKNDQLRRRRFNELELGTIFKFNDMNDEEANTPLYIKVNIRYLAESIKDVGVLNLETYEVTKFGVICSDEVDTFKVIEPMKLEAYIV